MNSEEISSALTHIYNSTSTLNSLTDKAHNYIKAFEDYLNEKCHAGVSARVVIESHHYGPSEWTKSLEYRRYKKRYRIVVVTGDDFDPATGEDNYEIKPWNECDRETKIETFEYVTDLIIAISKAVDEQAKQIQESMSKVGNLLSPIIGKEVSS